MASFDFDSLSDAARKVFLAGVGAIAVGAEKTADVVNDLVEKGELTVEQGKAVNEELKHKAAEATSGASDAVLRARLKNMSAEETEKVKGYASEAEDIFSEYFSLDKSELDEIYRNCTDEDGYVYYTKIQEWAKKTGGAK